MKNRSINVKYLARVEGEGALNLQIKDNTVARAELRIFEPPRFFEAFLRGRMYYEAPDITSRICGICPVAYQMSAVHAMEHALGVKVEGQLRALRRLIYCGEWIESHALHVFMLHAPDFLGYSDAIRMAQDYPEQVRLGLRLKKLGNDIVATLGGREIHPINIRVGGFYRVPRGEELASLGESLQRGREEAVQAVRWIGTLPFPDFTRDYEFVALRHPDEYPLNEGRVASSQGLDITVSDYEAHFVETQVPYSHALQSTTKNKRAYLTGPLARYNLNYDRLPPLAQEAARDAGLGPVCRNPFQSIIVRMVELLYALDEAVRIIKSYERPEQPAVAVPCKSGIGCGATEAPRGLLYHRYRLDDQGIIAEAKIVPPTSQNQRIIEEDLAAYASRHLDLSDEQLTWQCEQVVRNFDPCISCATHFLKISRDPP